MFKKIVVAVVLAIAASAETTQAVQIRSATKAESKVETEQKWGFLKNIVNIDRFFDSGVKAWTEKWASAHTFSLWMMQWSIYIQS